jgi:dTDP-4-dehydrorhamnose 3,5-epimerase
MDEKSILIIGANGQLGKALQARYPAAKAVDSNDLDISDQSKVEAFNWDHIKVVLNAAAYTNVDGAETPEGRVSAWKVNAVGTANIARVATKNNLLLVHISTDYVFDGTQASHTEDEPFSPLNVYGQSKAAGDIIVGLVPRHYILRTSWVIGEGKNFVRTMLELGQRGVNPTVVYDQVGRLTFTSELVQAIDHLLTSESAYGTYNVSNSGKPASWADLALAIFEATGFDLSVTGTTTAEYYAGKTGIAVRPLQSTLDIAKLESTGFKLTDWQEDLNNYIRKELAT